MPNAGSEAEFINRLLQQGLLNTISGDAKDMFKARAQAFVNGEFHTQWIDYFGAPSATTTSGFAATSASAQVVTNRCGGSKTKFTSSGATGFHYEAGAMETVNAVGAQIVASMLWDGWLVESGLVVRAITGNAELGFCGLCGLQNNFTNSDATSGNYMILGVSGPQSLTNLTLRLNAGGTASFVSTAIPVETNVYRRYGLANDGMGTIYILRDGVIMQSLSLPVTQPQSSGALIRYERSNGGTTDVDVDYYAAAGPSI